ncbi:L domain-like protein, partial [Fragilariopsis cylindrus CCMP1102]
LLKLDLSNNNLVGTIPEELYKLTNIQKVYLFKNNLTGTISSQIGNLDSITHFHLSHNNLIGNIPNELKSDNNGIRPLEYFNVYSNQLTGTIPDDLRLRNVIYFDIGRNSLTGKLPNDIGTKFISLRHLYLDHNDFRGTIPDSYNTVGNGRLESFSIDHNRFTGTVPGERSMYNKLVQYTLHSNQFDRIDSDNCRIEVPQGEC